MLISVSGVRKHTDQHVQNCSPSVNILIFKYCEYIRNIVKNWAINNVCLFFHRFQAQDIKYTKHYGQHIH